MLLALLSVLTGLVYPLAMTGLAQVLFSNRANGSLIQDGGRVVGSELIGQSFSDPRFFWGRPSATTPSAYNASASSGSNLGPTNPALREAIVARRAALGLAPTSTEPRVPVDLLTASGSGLDPHLSPASVYFQLPRVARARGMSEQTLKSLVDRSVEPRVLGILGEPRVNVLKLNLALSTAADARP
jgi:K+-transporting ATPase ATPase C chain